MLESDYQPKVIERLESIFPGCMILKNDSGYRQGIPDLTIFYHDWWAWLEVKPSIFASFQPNQEWYLDWANEQGAYGSMICPENEEAIFNEIQQAYRLRR